MPITQVEFDIVEQSVLDVVNRVVVSLEREQHWSGGDWTKKVKSEISRLGREKGFWVCASDCEADSGEWLFDVTWLNYDRQNGMTLTGVPLVLESEWNRNGVDDDFQKLVVARAEHRVLLYEPRRRQSADEVTTQLLRHAKKLVQPGVADRYLFGYWSELNWRFEWSAYSVTVEEAVFPPGASGN